MTTYTFTAPTLELRKALESVLPHVCTVEDLPALNRVRAYVAGDGLLLAATDRFTAAVAQVDLIDPSGVVGAFDLSPQDAKDILAQFRVSDKTAGESMLQVEWTEKGTRITDVSGLFDGERDLGLPPAPLDDGFPDLSTLVDAVEFARVLDAGRDAPPYLAVSGKLLARFVTAWRTYGEPLAIEPIAGRPWRITCGPAFYGLLNPLRIDDDDLDKYAGHRSTWAIERFPVLHRAHPRVERPAEPGAEPADPFYSDGFAGVSFSFVTGGKMVRPETAVEDGIESYTFPVDPAAGDGAEDRAPVDRDADEELFRRALAHVTTTRSASRSGLQKALGITKDRARQLLADLETRGVVGPAPGGNGEREVLDGPTAPDTDGGDSE